MDFAVAAPGGVGPDDPVALTARGADPLITIPPAPHLLRRVRGLTFQVGAPGGLAPIADSLPASTIVGMLGHAVAILRGAANSAEAAPAGYLFREVRASLSRGALYTLSLQPDFTEFCTLRC